MILIIPCENYLHKSNIVVVSKNYNYYLPINNLILSNEWMFCFVRQNTYVKFLSYTHNTNIFNFDVVSYNKIPIASSIN